MTLILALTLGAAIGLTTIAIANSTAARRALEHAAQAVAGLGIPAGILTSLATRHLTPLGYGITATGLGVAAWFALYAHRTEQDHTP